MCEVRNEGVAKGVIADVLNNRPRISIRASHFELLGSDARITATQQWRDRTLPSQIDQLLMRQDRIRAARPAAKEETHETDRESPNEIPHPLQYRSAEISVERTLDQGLSLTAGKQYYQGYYLGDTFQFNQRLTLNYGVRWELPGPWTVMIARWYSFLIRPARSQQPPDCP
jgi:hypothetical protein